MTSALDQVWAKSPRPGEQRGELLTGHLLAARDAAEALRRRTGVIPGIPEQFWDWVSLACLFHDAGKIPGGFQQMVGNPGPCKPWGQRHEVYSLGFAGSVLAGFPPADLAWVLLGIAVHHWPVMGDRSLEQRLNRDYRTPGTLAAALGPVDPETARELHNWLHRACGAVPSAPPSPGQLATTAHRHLDDLVTRWTGEDQDLLVNLTGVLLQGAVTLADRAASARVGFLLGQPLDGTYPQALTTRLTGKGRCLFPHQERVLDIDGHLLLRAPTGTGKTEAALLWASRQTGRIQAARGGCPRVFYTLPYLASINAMSARLRTEFSETAGADLVGIAHSRAASYYLDLAVQGDCGGENDTKARARAAAHAVARNQATRLFREPVRVGTPYQLLRGALAGPAHSGILIDSANSVFILDELHAYEPKRLGMILAMTSLWTRLGGRIAVISATMPRALAKLITQALDSPPALVEPDPAWTWPRRHRLELRPGHLTDPASVTEIKRRLDAGTSVLVAANNVASALALYTELSPSVISVHGKDAALLLHSRFKARDRAVIEEKILDRFEAGGPRQPGLLVATQTVEVSLNVDFDVIHTSCAPLESLIQRFGRVNRLGTLPGPAPVVVYPPSYGPRGRSGPEFADGVYDAEPVRLSWDVLARFDGAQLDEQLFTQWLDEIYGSSWGGEWQDEVTRQRGRWQEWLRFDQPFDNRDHLAGKFDELFDGTEGILDEDRDTYRELLAAGGTRAEGRLLAADLLLPLPAYGGKLGTWDKDLKVTVIDGDYGPRTGLRGIRGRHASSYQPGEVL